MSSGPFSGSRARRSPRPLWARRAAWGRGEAVHAQDGDVVLVVEEDDFGPQRRPRAPWLDPRDGLTRDYVGVGDDEVRGGDPARALDAVAAGYAAHAHRSRPAASTSGSLRGGRSGRPRRLRAPDLGQRVELGDGPREQLGGHPLVQELQDPGLLHGRVHARERRGLEGEDPDRPHQHEREREPERRAPEAVERLRGRAREPVPQSAAAARAAISPSTAKARMLTSVIPAPKSGFSPSIRDTAPPANLTPPQATPTSEKTRLQPRRGRAPLREDESMRRSEPSSARFYPTTSTRPRSTLSLARSPSRKLEAVVDAPAGQRHGNRDTERRAAVTGRSRSMRVRLDCYEAFTAGSAGTLIGRCCGGDVIRGR